MNEKPTHVGLFAGIGGFELAADRAGFQTIATAEIEPQACAVLREHWPGVPNLGDVSKITAASIGRRVVCLTGGFPCQDLSVAGKRQGLAGARSGLWHQFRRIIGDLKPRFVVIENVPGLLSSNTGQDFDVVLEGLEELGYCSAWRTLDAQYFNLAQRRERVFIVGSLGDGSCAEILFEPESLRWNPAPCRETRERIAPTLEGRAGRSGATNFHTSGGLIESELVGALNDGAHSGGGLNGQDAYSGRIFAVRSMGVAGAGCEGDGQQHQRGAPDSGAPRGFL